MRCNIPMPDLPQRLDHTYCLYKDKPVLVRAEIGSKTLYLYHVVHTGMTIATIESDDPDLDIATPPMGYCQYMSDRVCFITRRPQRQFKQGVYSDNVSIEYLETKRRDYSFKWNSPPAYHMLAREYPSFEEVFLKILKSEAYGEYALSNDIAIVDNGSAIIQVFFRNEEVGFIRKSEDMDVSRPTVVIPKSRKDWVVLKYLSDFNFKFK